MVGRSSPSRRFYLNITVAILGMSIEALGARETALRSLNGVRHSSVVAQGQSRSQPTGLDPQSELTANACAQAARPLLKPIRKNHLLERRTQGLSRLPRRRHSSRAPTSGLEPTERRSLKMDARIVCYSCLHRHCYLFVPYGTANRR